jgi:hypothetical protein
MITNSAKWSHPRGNPVVPSPWQATPSRRNSLAMSPLSAPGRSLASRCGSKTVNLGTSWGRFCVGWLWA